MISTPSSRGLLSGSSRIIRSRRALTASASQADSERKNCKRWAGAPWAPTIGSVPARAVRALLRGLWVATAPASIRGSLFFGRGTRRGRRSGRHNLLEGREPAEKASVWSSGVTLPTPLKHHPLHLTNYRRRWFVEVGKRI